MRYPFHPDYTDAQCCQVILTLRKDNLPATLEQFGGRSYLQTEATLSQVHMSWGNSNWFDLQKYVEAEHKAKMNALDYTNNTRKVRGLKPLTRINKHWWDMYGQQWVMAVFDNYTVPLNW